MDILTDAAIWVIERGAQATLAFGRWASNTFIWFLDWSSQKTVNGLRLLADLAEWTIDNPMKAVQNLALIAVIVLLVLMVQVYFYDLIKRRNALYRARMRERGEALEA